MQLQAKKTFEQLKKQVINIHNNSAVTKTLVNQSNEQLKKTKNRLLLPTNTKNWKLLQRKILIVSF